MAPKCLEMLFMTSEAKFKLCIESVAILNIATQKL